MPSATSTSPHPNTLKGDTRGERMGLVRDSGTYLVEHMYEVPVLLSPCLLGRAEESPLGAVSYWASLFPAVWSFCLALCSGGLGTCWTSLHLLGDSEQRVARGTRHSLRQVQPGRAVAHRLHQRNRLPAGQPAARRERSRTGTFGNPGPINRGCRGGLFELSGLPVLVPPALPLLGMSWSPPVLHSREVRQALD